MTSFDEIIEKLKQKTTIDSNNCWIYNGADYGEGYTQITFNYNQIYVHRLSAHIYHSLDLNSKLQANHKPECKNRKCWNPDHIYVGTQSENMNDRFLTRTNQIGIFGKALMEKNQTHCKHGHEFTPENTRIYKGKRNCKLCNKIRDTARVRQRFTIKGVRIG